MQAQTKKSYGKTDYEDAFRKALQRTLRTMDKREAIVCMKCLRFIRDEDSARPCCKRMGFPVDPDSVVVDKATGKVTHAAPPVKRETSEDA